MGVKLVGHERWRIGEDLVWNRDPYRSHPDLASRSHRSAECQAEDLHPCADPKHWHPRIPEPGKTLQVLQEGIVFQRRTADDDSRCIPQFVLIECSIVLVCPGQPGSLDNPGNGADEFIVAKRALTETRIDEKDHFSSKDARFTERTPLKLR
ncbi:MAG: hypothetical protein A4E38_01599 [Methanoregulaceae archaeon PtaB.Bin108]|nr:MAG: hypothetical protein A4E38_01599 [Methanoregulaceae archaeon PtaB.Bin108]